MHHTDKYSQHSSITWPDWLNDKVFVCELSECGFKSSCSHLNPKYIQNDPIWAQMSKPINELKKPKRPQMSLNEP